MAFAGCFASQEESDEDPTPGPGDDSSQDWPIQGEALEMGRWLEPFEMEVPAIHATLMADGRILYWDGLHAHGASLAPIVESPDPAVSRILDLSGPEPVITTPDPEDGGASDLFCVGQALLHDGRVLAVGGSEWFPLVEDPSPVYGTRDVRLFDPVSDTWEQAPDMAHARWYPSVLTLPDGRALIAGGIEDISDQSTMIEEIEVFDPATDTVTELPSSADRDLPMYPRLFSVPSGPLKGDVFYQPGGCLWCPFGTTPTEASWNFAASLNVDSATWTTHDPSVLGARQAPVTVLMGLHPPEYKAEILTATGTLNRMTVATPTAEMTDLSTDPPTHRLTGSMEEGRWQANHVLLPDDTVLVVGGSRVDGIMAIGADTLPMAPVLEAELFDPDKTDPVTGEQGAWTTLAPMEIPRVYHSTALLLPDARVLVAGSVPAPEPTGQDPVYETAAEIYEPPYLFRGPQPVIDGVPEHITYGEVFDVMSPDADRVTGVVMVRPGSVTHVYNPEQRLVGLEVLESADGALTVRAPPNADVAPPGAWMVFVLADTPDGPVPSKAAFLHIE